MAEAERLDKVLKTNANMRAAYLGRSLAELCIAVGLEPGKVYQWLNHGNPQLSSVVAIAEALSVPAHSLLDPSFEPRAYPPSTDFCGPGEG